MAAPQWLPRDQWPAHLTASVGQEEALFAFREGRMVSSAGANGAYVVGGIFALVGFLTFPNVITVALGIAGLALIVATPFWRSRPGGWVVGTPTRLLRASKRATKVAEWRDIGNMRVGKDGSITFERADRSSQTVNALAQIVEPPHAERVAAIISERIGRGAADAPAAPAAGRAAAAELTFSGTHLPQRGLALFGVLFAAMGIFVVLLTTGILLGGGTLTMRSGSRTAPGTEVGASDPSAWVPALMGLVFFGVGAFLARQGMRPAPRATFAIRAEGVHVREEGGATRLYAWREFTGASKRETRKGRVILAFPLHPRPGRRGRAVRETLRIGEIDDVDAAEAAILARLRTGSG